MKKRDKRAAGEARQAVYAEESKQSGLKALAKDRARRAKKAADTAKMAAEEALRIETELAVATGRMLPKEVDPV